MAILKLGQGERIKVFGPASITVKKGQLEVLGKKLGSGERLIIHKLKSYIVIALNDSDLEVILGENASIQSVEPGDPYNDWAQIAGNITASNTEKVIILGGVDEGKSSFSILLANKALENGLKPALIDADMGQADIGPPGFISLAYPDKQVTWMRELKPVAMKFIGDIKPQNVKYRVIHKVSELVEKAVRDNRQPVIIDTDGWISDVYAVIYKSQMIEEVKPDTIVVLGERNHGLFSRYRLIGIRVYEARAPVNRRTRSREERRMLRSDKYREFLAEAKTVKIPMDKVVISGTPIFTGRTVEVSVVNELTGVKAIYASKIHDTLYLVLGEPGRITRIDALKKVLGIDKVRYYYGGFEKNLYIAITDREGDDYPALLESVNYERRELIVKTKYTNIDPVYVKFSNIKILENYTEQLLE